MYLLDTNACLDFLLARNDDLRDRVREERGRIIVSSISAAELNVGSKTSERPGEDTRFLELFLASVQLAPFDERAASVYGQIARVHGVVRHSFDRLIAAHAVALGVPLVTADERGFAGIPGLSVQNWRA